MEQLLVEVKSKEKAKMLFELLSALDFVEQVKTGSVDNLTAPEEPSDFFALAGLWAGREVSLESIRE
jgi:pheromone shutdown protein TraB